MHKRIGQILIFSFVFLGFFICKFDLVQAYDIAAIAQKSDLPISIPLASSTAQTALTPAPSLGYLEQYLAQIGRPKLSPLTFMRYLIHSAVDRGVSASMIVFLLMFPVIASLVAFSRHVIGLTGFSIYAPTALAVVLLSTGIIPGIILFFLMLGIAAVGKWAISFLKLEYIPRTAMLLWFVAIGMFFSLLFAVIVPAPFVFRIEMFPLLILVLLAEDFMGTQGEIKWSVSLERAFQVMLLAVVGAVIMGDVTVQRFVLTEPELVVLAVGIFNILVGKYLGLRLTEYFRFKPIIDAEE